jgi:F420-non-reducing hydrogenase iron-sulfur subunit
MSHQRKIIAFCCHWCGYAAADLAGIQRLQYSCDVRIIRLMCSGMVHPEFVVDALAKGADGVMVIGCRLGECHYRDGNYKAAERSGMIIDLMEDLGFEPARFAFHWLSSVETEEFVRAVNDMSQVISVLDADQ